jgi:subtilase family serine protease
LGRQGDRAGQLLARQYSGEDRAMRYRQWITALAAATGIAVLTAGVAVASPPWSDAPDTAPVRVTLSLVGASGEGSLARYAQAVSTPGNPWYGKHLNRDQLRARFGATTQQLARVRAWAAGSSWTFLGVDATGTQVTLSASPATAEFSFGVHLGTATHAGVRVRTAGSPRIPTALAGVVDGVSGLSGQAVAPAHVAVPAVSDSSGCQQFWGLSNNTDVPQKYGSGLQGNLLCGYTAAQLRALYHLGSADTGSGQTIVIVGAYNSPTALADANVLAAANDLPPLTGAQYQVRSYSAATGVTGCDVGSWNAEQALDIQTVHAIAPAASILYVAAPDCGAVFDATAGVVADASVSATVISASWGTATEPTDVSSTVAFNNVLAQAAVLGIGFYAASGDHGDDSGLPGASGPSVSYPASSPWATAVGGTSTALNASNGVVWQTGWEDAANAQVGNTWVAANPAFVDGAGGGPSGLFAAPGWQTAVTGSGRRMVPDVSGLADPFTGFRIGYTTGGQFFTSAYGGTSLATPIIASLVAVAQAKAGSGADVGFLAPVLYAKQAAGAPVTTDVAHVAAGIWTPGVGDSTGSFLLDMDAGGQTLTTRAGWDPVTGLGVPSPTFLAGVTS